MTRFPALIIAAWCFTLIHVPISSNGASGDPVGACCITSICAVLPQSTCEAAGGSYQGDGTSCDPDPCSGGGSIGACCIAASCLIVDEAVCEAVVGSYQGDDTSCDPDPCNGACCLPGDSCQPLTQEECRVNDGIWLSGEECDPNPCQTTPTEQRTWGAIKNIYR